MEPSSVTEGQSVSWSFILPTAWPQLLHEQTNTHGQSLSVILNSYKHIPNLNSHLGLHLWDGIPNTTNILSSQRAEKCHPKEQRVPTTKNFTKKKKKNCPTHTNTNTLCGHRPESELVNKQPLKTNEVMNSKTRQRASTIRCPREKQNTDNCVWTERTQRTRLLG